MARPSLAEAHRGLALPAPISIAGTVDGNSAVRKSTSEHLDRPRSFRAVAVVSTEPVWTLAQDDEQERWSRLLLPTQGRLATSAGMDELRRSHSDAPSAFA